MYAVINDGVQEFGGSLKDCFQYLLETFPDLTIAELIEFKVSIEAVE